MSTKTNAHVTTAKENADAAAKIVDAASKTADVNAANVAEAAANDAETAANDAETAADVAVKAANDAKGTKDLYVAENANRTAVSAVKNVGIPHAAARDPAYLAGRLTG